MPLQQPVEVVSASALGHVHFIGVGGVSMSGIARLMAEAGLRVSGSDREESPALNPLRAAGVEVHVGHDPANVAGADTVIITSAIRESNPELAAARAAGLRVWHRSTALASLMVGHRGVGVSGTHGKTSTSGMVVAAMRSLDPCYALGSRLATTGKGSDMGTGAWFVVEADESDGSFLQLDLDLAVITNIEADHLDNWGTPARYAEGFRAFATRPGLRCVVLSADDPGTRALADELATMGHPILTYGESADADLVLSDIDEGSGPGRGASAVLAYEGTASRLTLGVPGRHSLHNAAAAYAVARLAGIDDATARSGVESFRGTARRFQLVAEVGGVCIVDDYAHHPTEVRAALRAARAYAGDGRVVVVFQPHLFSRTRDFATEFGRELAAADVCVLTDIYPAREDPIEGVTSQLVVDAVAAAGSTARLVGPLDDVPAALAELVVPGDVVVTVGAGSITRVGPRLATLLEHP